MEPEVVGICPAEPQALSQDVTPADEGLCQAAVLGFGFWRFPELSPTAELCWSLGMENPLLEDLRLHLPAHQHGVISSSEQLLHFRGSWL